MAKRYSKAGRRLRQTQTQHAQQMLALQRELNTQLAQFTDQLFNVLHSHRFYQDALLALIQDGPEPDPWFEGALTTHRWLNQEGQGLLQQIHTTRQWVHGL